MIAYYNEIDPNAAAWLRELIRRGLVAKGEVDERSIKDVEFVDLLGYTQCHFFAGIGGWSHALRLARWPDDRPVWTGSCPCQPFSAAGKRGGVEDVRHLWPEFFRLIRSLQPDVVFGEQVASPDGFAWFDLVHADLENAGYAGRAFDLCSAGVGASHIRQRLYWVAHTDQQQRRGHGNAGPGRRLEFADGGSACVVGDTERSGLAQRLGLGKGPGRAGGSDTRQAVVGAGVLLGELADADRNGRAPVSGGGQRSEEHHAQPRGAARFQPATRPAHIDRRDADWLFCRDGRWRPVEPGTFPLAHGLPARVGRLRGYGNAIDPLLAAEFVGAWLDAKEIVELFS